MGEEIRLTVIATGFEGTGRGAAPAQNRSKTAPNAFSRQTAAEAKTKAEEMVPVQRADAHKEAAPKTYQPPSFKPDDIDIPAYLRQRYNRSKDS